MRSDDHRYRAGLGAGLLAAIVALAACQAGAPATSLPSSEPTEAAASASATPPPGSGPSATPTTEPTDPEGNHVATGLAIVRAPSDASPRTELYIVEPDGELRQVTGLSEGDALGAAGPVWAPDGSRIAYGASILDSGPFPAILVVNADGTGQRLVQQLDAEEYSRAAWSADGSRLLFSDATPPGDRRIWLADMASGTVSRIGTGSVPRWLPGRAGISFLDGVTGLVPGDPSALTMVAFVMDLADGVPHRFMQADNLHWSPDGSAVLIEKDGRILLAAADGSDRHELAAGSQPAWSPDGARIAYQHATDQDGRSLLAVMDRTGRLLWSGVVGSGASWSSDGSRVAVEVSYPELTVRVLDAATGNLLWETHGAQPAWRP